MVKVLKVDGMERQNLKALLSVGEAKRKQIRRKENSAVTLKKVAVKKTIYYGLSSNTPRRVRTLLFPNEHD